MKPFVKKDRYIAPLRCWDVYAHQSLSQRKTPPLLKDLETLEYFSEKFQWNNLPSLQSHVYDSLVLTDLGKKIIWVNGGFEQMTGYPPHFAIGKTPVFLQGKATSPVSKKRISRLLLSGKPFTSKILNYRKDHSTYICQINIFPLKNSAGHITHHLAIEKEL